MADTQKNNPHKKAAKKFWNAVKGNASVETLAGIIKKYPGLLESREFMIKAFPPHSQSKNKAGQISFSRTLKIMQKMKSLEAAGLISSETLNNFLNGKHPDTGETFATLAAKNAVAAYDKANIDRSPKANLSEDARQKFAAQAEYYRNTMMEMRKLGVSLSETNSNGESLQNIASMGKVNDAKGLSAVLSGQQPDASRSTALRVNVSENDEALEVGNGQPLKVEVNENKPALKVKTQPEQPQDPVNEATVEEAPEEDKGKRGEYQGERIREQDIIDYMYNEWFLAGLSWCLNKAAGSIVNSVDNLCEKYKRNTAKSVRKEKEHKDKRTKDFQAKGSSILRNTPNQMANQFSAGLNEKNNYTARLHDDILANVGKNPQQWTVLKPQNAEHAKMIRKINAAYAIDPVEFSKQIQAMGAKGSQQKNLMARVYALAVQQATVQYMAKKMQGTNIDFIDMNDTQIQSDIAKLAQKNSKALISGINAIAEHIGLASELRDGETRQDVIDMNKAKGVEKFLQLNEHQTAKAKAALMTNLEEGQFKYADEKLPKNTKKEIKKINSLLEDGEKQWEVLMPAKRKEYGMEDLAGAAARMNMEDIRQNNAFNAVTRDLDGINSQLSKNNERKKPIAERRQQYVEALKNNSSFKDYDMAAKNQKDTGLNVGRIIIEARQQRG